MNFKKVIEAAKNSTTDEQTLNRLEDIQIYGGWANSTEDKIILVSDWNNIQERDPEWGFIKFWRDKNNIMSRLRKIFESNKFKDIVEIAWKDMVTFCDECGLAIDHTPSHAFWKPDFTVDIEGGSVVCHKCEPPKKKFNVTMPMVVYVTVKVEATDEASAKDVAREEFNTLDMEFLPDNMKYETPSSGDDWEVEESH